METSDFHFSYLVGRISIPIPISGRMEVPNPPKSNLYSFVVFKFHFDSEFGYEPNTLRDMVIYIPIPIYFNSNSNFGYELKALLPSYNLAAC